MNRKQIEWIVSEFSKILVSLNPINNKPHPATKSEDLIGWLEDNLPHPECRTEKMKQQELKE